MMKRGVLLELIQDSFVRVFAALDSEQKGTLWGSR